MICSNCNKKIHFDVVFCPYCGIKKTNEFNHPKEQTVITKEQAVITQELSTIDEVSRYLSNVSTSNEMLQYIIKAQLQVLKVVQHFDLYEMAFATMLQSLDDAMLHANKSFKRELRRKSSIMTANMVFFIQAKFIYDKEENRKEAYRLLNSACELLADSVNDLIEKINIFDKSENDKELITKAAGIVGVGAGVALGPTVLIVISAAALLKCLTKQDAKGESFINKAVNWFKNRNKNKRDEYDFYIFLNALFKKMDRNFGLFGPSILLSELIHQYKERVSLIEAAPLYVDDSYLKDGMRPILTSTTSLLFFFIAIHCFAWVISLIPSVSWSDSTWIWLVYATGGFVLINSIAFIVYSISYLIKKKKYNNELRWLNRFYTDLAEDFRP